MTFNETTVTKNSSVKQILLKDQFFFKQNKYKISAIP